MIELKQIQYFTACAQTGSFSKAAEILYTTQSNVSKVIRSMEQEMDVVLFERYAKGILLTPAGEHVYKYSSQILDSLKMLSHVEETREIELLRVCANPSSWFADQFVKYYQLHSKDKLHYQIYSANSHEIVDRIRERMDDAGFLYVMKNQYPAFQYYLGRNYLEFVPLTETCITIYPGQKHDYWTQKEPNNQKISFSDLKLVQRYPEEYSTDNYWEIQDHEGNSAANAEAVVTTNSDYIMERLLQVSDLANISCGYLSGQAWREVTGGITLEPDEKQVLYGYIKRQNEELTECVREFVAFLTEQLV